MQNAQAFIPELEQEVLGALLFDGSLKPVSGRLRPEHFLVPAHRHIFEKMEIADQQYGSTRLAVVTQLFDQRARESLSRDVGEPFGTYLARIATGSVRGSAGFKDSIPALLQQWARLSVAAEAETVREAAQDPGTDPRQLIRHLNLALETISGSIRSGRRSVTRFSMAEASSAAITAIEEARARGDGLTGVTWGLADVDRATGGMQRGEMTVMGARPSMGKTAVGLSVSIKAARAGTGVGFISLEMGARTLAMRALSDIAFDQYGNIPYSDLIGGKVNERDMLGIYAAEESVAGLPLQIEDAPGLTVLDIRTKFERMAEIAERAGKPIEVLVVDYLQLIQASGRYAGNRTVEVTEISNALRNMAREYNIALIALAQLSRGVESRPLHERRPMLSDLRESGSIEQDADTVIFLFRESYYLSKERGKNADEEAARVDRLLECENRLEFVIAKNRNGPTRTVDLFIDIACSAVRNAVRS